MNLFSLTFLLGVAYLAILIITALLVYWIIEVKAMIKSTHKIAYVDPMSGVMTGQEQVPDIMPLTNKEKEKLQEDYFGNVV